MIEIVRSTQQVLENLDKLIKKVCNTDAKYKVDDIYNNKKAYINKIFESWKSLATDCSSDSQVIADSMIACTVAASNIIYFFL